MASKNWTKEEIEFLTKNYPSKGKMFCSSFLGRTEASIRRKVTGLNIKFDFKSDFHKDWQERAGKSKIGKKRPDQSKFLKSYIAKNKEWNDWSKERRKRQSIISSTRIQEKGHPRGMLGKIHSDETKKILSEKFRVAWKNPKSKHNSKEYRQLVSDNSSRMMNDRIRNKGSVYSRSHNGWYKIKGKIYYFRSSWEVNYARYLEWLVEKKEIKFWRYEARTFWFEKIRRGVRSYNPDFEVINNNDSVEYHEVKGWMDGKSKTKIKRMKKYFPEIKLLIIDKDIYKSIIKFERLFPESEKFIDKKNPRIEIEIK